MRIAIVGGGPGGLYFAALTKQLNPGHEITVWERNGADDTFGFGVVFSDETLGAIENADPVIYDRMARHFARWDDIDVHFRGTVHTAGGQGFAAMSRKVLLHVLQERAIELGVTVHFSTAAPDVDSLRGTYDLVLAADGLNSAVRSRYADTFEPTLDARRSKYMWLGTDKVFDAFKFYIVETPHGVMQIHGYPYGDDGSTFIVEMHEDVWKRAGFDANAERVLAPGESDEESIDIVREMFADVLGDHRILSNNSRWINFTTVRNEHWHEDNVVILGDAAHTAHFSIGSGTKLAMEDALALAACLHENPTVESALTAYESERKPVVVSVQRAAQASLEWFENIGQYVDQEPRQFAFNIMTRSRRITYDNLKLRDPEFVAHTDEWFAGDAPSCPPMFQPFTVGNLELNNRILVSSMDMYSAVDGIPGDFHLVHLGSKAMGGPALVMTEMVCVSPTGRITPGCTGLYTDEQEQSWARIVEFVHTRSAAKIGVQLGHSGRKGSTKLRWEGIDEPLDDGNWATVSASALPYSDNNSTPAQLDTAGMASIEAEFAAAAVAAGRAGFDILELHCAHGYLLSSFLSPLSNTRDDDFGGSVENRLRFPLRVFDAVRMAWPAERPMSVRISATDWADGGNDIDDAVSIAAAFAMRGVEVINVSSGQVVSSEKPQFGRSYQTPFADRIRNEIGAKYGTAVIAVGAISSHDDVNSVLLAGRADLVALGRTHLYDPQWTLHAAAEQNYVGPGAVWPAQFAAGNRKPPSGRTDGPPPRLSLVRDGEAGTRHSRWVPRASIRA